MELNWSNMMHSIVWHTVGCTCPTVKTRSQIMMKTSNFKKRLQELPLLYHTVKTLAVHCHCDVCSAAGGHSAGCRTSWVCLQHHATVVTSNSVTVCGSKFPPTISKHCQHQHSAIHKTIQQYEIPTVPAVVISKVLLPQSNIMAACVRSHSNLFTAVSPDLPTQSDHNVTQYTVLFSTATSCWTRSASCPKYPTANTQQYISSLNVRYKGPDNIKQINNKCQILNSNRVKLNLQV